MESSFYETALDAAQDQEVVEEEDLRLDTLTILEVGRLTDSTTVGDHEIIFRTLMIGEELEAALLAQPYKDTVEESRALMTALLSKAIITVDGSPLLGETLGPFQETAEIRFKQLLKWHWPVIMRVYADFAALTDKVYKEYNEVKKG